MLPEHWQRITNIVGRVCQNFERLRKTLRNETNDLSYPYVTPNQVYGINLHFEDAVRPNVSPDDAGSNALLIRVYIETEQVGAYFIRVDSQYEGAPNMISDLFADISESVFSITDILNVLEIVNQYL